MKLFVTLGVCLALCGIACSGNAQIFWTENFESGSTGGLQVGSYSGPNGAWSLTTSISTTEASKPNVWYVSCAENGHTAGVCGTGCVPTSPTATGATLHIGSNPAVLGDMGASYDNGGSCFPISSSSSSSSYFSTCVTTDRRAESPTINCTGKHSITLSFNYIMNGQVSVDYGTVWYFDGTAWSSLASPAQTPLCGAQGQWAAYSVALPASANNNPSVKLGFRWVNNDDGIGSDPSFAVDSVALSAPAPPVASFTVTATTTCQDSSITFTSTSTGTIDSIRWATPGMVITTPHANPLTLPFGTFGIDTMHLYVFNASGVDSFTQILTIKKAPHPIITHLAGTAHHLSATTGYASYQWLSGATSPTIIAGATTNTYTYGVSGTFWVIVDSSNGCYGWDSLTTSNVSVATVSGAVSKFWVSSLSDNSIVLHASEMLNENLDVNIVDVSGREVATEQWPVGTDSKQINTLTGPPGSYLIRLSSPNTSQVLKWVKQ